MLPLLLFLFQFLGGIDNLSQMKSDTLYTEIIKFNDQALTFYSSEKMEISIANNNIEMFKIFNNKHEQMDYADLNIGDYIKITYSYYDEVIEKIDEIQVVDSKIEKQLLGLFVSTTEEIITKLPESVKNDSYNDIESVYMFPYVKIKKDRQTFSQIDRLNDVILLNEWGNHIDDSSNSYERFVICNITIPISSALAPSKYLRIYALDDTSENGFYLYETIDLERNSDTIVTISGSYYNYFYPEDNNPNYSQPFTDDITYNIRITNTRTLEELIICEYDSNHNLIVMKRFNEFNEFWQAVFPYKYNMSSKTGYVILEETYISFGQKYYEVDLINVADEREFIFANNYGYVQKIKIVFIRPRVE